MTKRKGYKVLLIIYILVVIAGGALCFYVNDSINQAVHDDKGVK